ncbi:BaiN/RdsA family NAD(P)/FAD-dependent oxidoreductase [Albibacterium indicum]|uniref:NAD(P)/FAD-dependent oxidoreductase n=1 Tax=Albibacterium indicum TaxID=2292082 RepID=UPI000E4E5807|nr:aminoacetone oxidase family FAD-binding enzyme [Pedobacter indicus]
MIYDAIIVGAGACGLMCGVQAAIQGKRVVLLEKNDKAGAKILISGGGRCNYTNLYANFDNFISADSDFCKDILDQWTVDDTVSFFESNGIRGQEKTLGQLFPVSNKAKDVVAVFVNLLREYGGELRLSSDVKAVRKNGDLFEVTYEKNGQEIKLQSHKVVMASGGLPIKKMGASDFSLRVARSFDLDLVETAPALVPLTITGKDKPWFADLAGNTVFSEVSIGSVRFKENILFTHWGLSGPAILQISSYWRPGQSIRINMLPNESMSDLIAKERSQGGKRLLIHLLQDLFTKKLAEALGKCLPTDRKIASMSKADAKLVDSTIHRFEVKPAGDKGYDKAEVMRGGVATHELDRQSLEAKKVGGLFFGGECVDVTGWLGGYNFQWAWAAGFAIAKRI